MAHPSIDVPAARLLSSEAQEALALFEELWRQGQRPALTGLLTSCPEAERPALLSALACAELQLRLHAGEAAQVEDYLQGFPQIAGDPEAVARLIASEFRHRFREDPAAAYASLRQRFPDWASLIEQLAHEQDQRSTLGCCPHGQTPPPGFTEAPKPGGLPSVAGFEVLEELGRGGMGVVYRARHLALNRVVALKMVLAGPHAGPDELQRFRSETEAVARLQHPGIVQIYEVGVHAGLPYAALEYCPGGSLASALHGNPVAPAAAARVSEALARSVQAAHEQQVIHRDLKPANVLLAADGQPKVTDFGLAKRLDDVAGLTHSGAIMGTPSYMAPEQAGGRSKEVGPATDVYSLGAILYELLTGRPPFKALTVMDTVLQVLHDDPVPPSRLQPRVPRDLETICLKCLSKEPHRRYPSAAEMAEDLQRWQAGEPIQARPAGLIERGLKWARRRPAAAAALAVALLALTVVIGGGVVYNQELQSALTEARDQRAAATQATALAGTHLKTAEANLRVAEAKTKESQENFDLAQIRRRRAEEIHYASTIQLAQAEWQERRVERVADLLAAAGPPRLRGWEWGHLYRVLHSAKRTINLQAMVAPLATAYSPDGQYLAVAGWSLQDSATLTAPIVCLWSRSEPDRAPEVLVIGNRGEGIVTALAFRPGSKEVLVGTRAPGRGSVIHVWDMVSKSLVRRLEGHRGDMDALAVSPDGKLIASGANDRLVRVWSGENGKLMKTLQGHSAGITAVAWFPGGAKLVSASGDRTVKVWDVARGDELFALDHPDRVESVAFSGDGKWLASASGSTVRLWQANSGRLVHTLQHDQPVPCITFDPTGTRLAALSLLFSRSSEVRLWHVASGQVIRTYLPGMFGPVFLASQAVAFSPDGDELALGIGHLISIWDSRRGAGVRFFPVANKRPFVRFSQDGRYLASPGPEIGTVKITGPERELLLKGHEKYVNSIDFGPDGKTFASVSSDQTVKLWSLDSGQVLHTIRLPSGNDKKVVFSPDGKRVATCGGDLLRNVDKAGQVRFWDASTGRDLGALSHGAFVNDMAFSPDGRFLATAAKSLKNPQEDPLKIWDVASGKIVHSFPSTEYETTAVAFSADGTRLVSGSLGLRSMVHGWDVRSGLKHFSISLDTGLVALALFTDGRRLVTSDMTGRIQLWDVPQGRALLHLDVFKAAGEVVVATRRVEIPGLRLPPGMLRTTTALAVSPHGTRLAAAADNGVVMWEAAPNLEVLTRQGATAGNRPVSFNPRGTQLAVGTGKWTNLLDSRAAAGRDSEVVFLAHSVYNRLIHRLLDAKPQPAGKSKPERILERRHAANVLSLAYSPEGAVLAAASWDGHVSVTDVAADRLVHTLTGHEGGVWSVAFSPKDKLVASGGADATVRLWSSQSGRQVVILRGHRGPVLSVAYSPDGKWLASAGADETVKLWDAKTRTERRTLRKHEGFVRCVAFSPDGRRLVSASDDWMAIVWDVESGKALFTLDGHTQGLRTVAYSRDGRWIATAGEDTTVRLWDAATGREHSTFKNHTRTVTAVAFHPNGRQLASQSEDGSIYYHDLPRVARRKQ
jgi:WD40 repeat protein